jgi:hypothetical protein
LYIAMLEISASTPAAAAVAPYSGPEAKPEAAAMNRASVAMIDAL